MLEVTMEFDEASLDRAFEELTNDCTQIVRGIAVTAWNQILEQTPQKFGRAAASWTWSYDAPLFLDRSHMIDPMEIEIDDYDDNGFLYKGHPHAISIANMFAAPNSNSPKFKLGTTIYFANGVDHGEGAYAGALEDGSITLRAVNRPGEMVRRALDTIYSRFGWDVPEKTAEYLKYTKLGVP